VETADDVRGPVAAEPLQADRGQARGVALQAQDDDLQVVSGCRQPRLAGRVEPPLQHVALDDQRTRNLALGSALPFRTDVHQHGAVLYG
jgi:hypothetical protein